jgi:hypothetical protein
MRGHAIRGFFAGLLLGIVLDLDLFLGGAVRSDSSALTIVPIVCIALGFLLGLWAPIGRRSGKTQANEPVRPVGQTLPHQVAWPETAPVEGSAVRTPGAWKAPPPAPPPDNSGPPTSPPPAPSI